MEERKEIKLSVLNILLIAVIAALGFYVIHILDQNHELNKYQEEHSIRAEVEKVNQNFVAAFFTYSNTGERYAKIKKYTTSNGFKSTYPSGSELPKSVNVSSAMDNLRMYVTDMDQKKIQVYSEFLVTTTFNEVTSRQTVTLKTELIPSNGWKVNNVEILQNEPLDEIQ